MYHVDEDRRYKRYVEVICHYGTEGDITPEVVLWDDGTRYPIERVVAACQAHSFKVGGTGIRYSVRIHGRTTHLWHEERRWFVEAKVPPRPSPQAQGRQTPQGL